MFSNDKENRKQEIGVFANNSLIFNKNLNTAEGKSHPTQIKCPFCSQFITTTVKNKVGKGTLKVSCILLIIFFPFFWVPCCLNKCQDRIHFCGKCGNIVGTERFDIC